MMAAVIAMTEKARATVSKHAPGNPFVERAPGDDAPGNPFVEAIDELKTSSKEFQQQLYSLRPPAHLFPEQRQ